jgi:uncharacterized protein (TIGR02300 family)
MAPEARGKKHMCPYCSALFYDMGREAVVCPKCKKGLSAEAELDFIKRKKKAEAKPKEDKAEAEFEVGEDNVDASESEMFFDMEGEENIGRAGRLEDDEY